MQDYSKQPPPTSYNWATAGKAARDTKAAGNQGSPAPTSTAPNNAASTTGAPIIAKSGSSSALQQQNSEHNLQGAGKENSASGVAVTKAPPGKSFVKTMSQLFQGSVSTGNAPKALQDQYKQDLKTSGNKETALAAFKDRQQIYNDLSKFVTSKEDKAALADWCSKLPQNIGPEDKIPASPTFQSKSLALQNKMGQVLNDRLNFKACAVNANKLSPDHIKLMAEFPEELEKLDTKILVWLQGRASGETIAVINSHILRNDTRDANTKLQSGDPNTFKTMTDKEISALFGGNPQNVKKLSPECLKALVANPNFEGALSASSKDSIKLLNDIAHLEKCPDNNEIDKMNVSDDWKTALKEASANALKETPSLRILLKHGYDANQIKTINEIGKTMLADTRDSFTVSRTNVIYNGHSLSRLTFTKKDGKIYLHHVGAAYANSDILGRGASSTAKVVLDLQSGDTFVRLVPNNPNKVAFAATANLDADEIENNYDRQGELLNDLKGAEGVLQAHSVTDIKEGKPGLILPIYASDLEKVSKDQSVTLEDRLSQVAQAGKGVENMHKQGIVHRDLKPNNMLSDGKKAVVSDFDLAITKHHGKKNFQPDFEDSAKKLEVGTMGYMAPEMHNSANRDVYIEGGIAGINTIDNKPISKDEVNFALHEKMDVYSYGATLKAVVYGMDPNLRRAELPQRDWYNLDVAPQPVKVTITAADGKTETLTSDSLNSQSNIPGIGELNQLINDTMKINPWKRPSMEEVNTRLAAIMTQLQGSGITVGSPVNA